MNFFPGFSVPYQTSLHVKGGLLDLLQSEASPGLLMMFLHHLPTAWGEGGGVLFNQAYCPTTSEAQLRCVIVDTWLTIVTEQAST